MIVFLNLWVSCLAHSGCLVIGSLTNMSLFWCFPLRLLSHIVKNSLFRFITWHRCSLTGFVKHMMSQVGTRLMFYLWTFLSFQGSKVLYWTLGLFSSFLPPPADNLVSEWETAGSWSQAVCVWNEGPLLIKVSDYVLLSKRLRAGPTTFLQHRKKFNVVIIADLESLDSNMEKPTP